MNIVIYDIETFQNCFTITFYEPVKDMYYQFVISSLRNDFDELGLYLGYLRDNNFYMVGFNNVNFDYPVLHEIIEQEIDNADIIYGIAQNIINMEYSSIPEWKMYIKQIDLYRINHYNNRARTQSLKGLQINMQLDDVRDMPYNHKYVIKTIEEIDNVLSYNKWDVYSTHIFYLKNIERITLRIELNKLYNINVLNQSDVGIGEALFLKFLAEDMDIDKKILRQKRTFRSSIAFKDIILDYIKYDNEKLNNLLTEFKSIVIKNTKDGFKKSLLLNNEIYEFAQGGLHQSTKSGIYESTDDILIIDIDVSLKWRN